MTADGWQPSDRELERRRLRSRDRTRSMVIATGAMVVVFAGLVVRRHQLARVADASRRRSSAGSTRRPSFPAILDGFWINVQLFLIAEPFILVLGLAVALARQARSPWLAPVRVVAVVYTDLFRGIPTILLVLLLAFGMPSLRLQGVPNSLFFWAWSRWSCRTAPTSPRCSGPASSRSTRRRSRAPRRSRCPAPRRCGTSWSRRRCAASYPRCSTTSSRCRRTPRWWRRSASSTRCSRRRTTATSTSTTRRSSWSPASSSR